MLQVKAPHKTHTTYLTCVVNSKWAMVQLLVDVVFVVVAFVADITLIVGAASLVINVLLVHVTFASAEALVFLAAFLINTFTVVSIALVVGTSVGAADFCYCLYPDSYFSSFS